jgi:hypothetical protein
MRLILGLDRPTGGSGTPVSLTSADGICLPGAGPDHPAHIP